jgi:[ribosomal protein S18]-alanine N-acetyltransferase
VNGWHFEHINPADLEPILAIEQNSFQRPWGRLSFEGELRNRSACNYAVKSTEVKSSGQVIGYAFWHLVADEVHVLKVAVTPAWRGQGIASRLLERCFTSSVEQGAKSAHLEVRPSNIAAIELYQKLGFELVGRRPKYYTDSKEDALLMIKDLTGLNR